MFNIFGRKAAKPEEPPESSPRSLDVDLADLNAASEQTSGVRTKAPEARRAPIEESPSTRPSAALQDLPDVSPASETEPPASGPRSVHVVAEISGKQLQEASAVKQELNVHLNRAPYAESVRMHGPNDEPIEDVDIDVDADMAANGGDEKEAA